MNNQTPPTDNTACTEDHDNMATPECPQCGAFQATPTDTEALVEANNALGELLAFEEWQAHEGGVVPDRFIGVLNRAISAHRAALSREAPQTVTVDQIAQVIRTVDGDNTMGAGELAEHIHRALGGRT